MWRHGRTQWNADGRFQGQLDPPLDTTGVRQAQAAAVALAGWAPAALVSSDAQRALATANVLAGITGLPVTADRRLREISLGGWEGLNREQVSERFPLEYADWLTGVDGRRGGGETYAEVAVRVTTAIAAALAVLAPGRTLVAVTHGGAARAMLGGQLDLPAGHWWRLGPLGNARWTVLVETSGGWRLAEHNVGGPAALVG